ncbi:hypothetical protein ECHHL_0524 [Ehrlichia chaffeensis str. Heartland]|uniref:hypothetical protein n=1 Tax=Ehrlichia chaffeensis TaxID=945 RepID=UPI000053C5AD|nr:hypothetical protein [Ehrlichia chaffeensis]AHX03682.1 hypothetical protein ECHHL_0524 [Ehrlichia chaffeensis str. Heartland]AHX05597.1 hypothetical protein ECHJAX_0533 [Ehrlichia chaffeensis str. Jax]AHX06587.1 hypothetical protein ECHLIB_0534 [Ehrlichia chaffeensis str. Liberty]AHX07573.1 hypothetical protein ECHOSC_0532 [Ehrlichia chaffeensis str. Osceola]AHX08803.1 hypothetical protein ECHSTV_0522 [Ehrlichia chaffeensis str. Saint Vincent]
MQLLILLLDKNSQMFLSSADSYRSENDTFVTNDPVLKSIIGDTSANPSASPNYDPTLYGALFTKYCVVRSNNCLNEIIILSGLNNNNEEVFVALSVSKNEFKSFTQRTEHTPCFFFNKENYIGGGATNGRSVKQLFCDVKTNATFIPQVNASTVRSRFNFCDEDGKIVDAIYCAGTLTEVSATGLGNVRLL